MLRHRIQFPPEDSRQMPQSEASFFLYEEDERQRLRFHDYDEIFRRPGLYEQVFYDRLGCTSPVKVSEILDEAVNASGERMSNLRVLDLGAGNGIMGEALIDCGVARMVGADIIPEAKEAALRDRPGVYDDYIVADFTDLSSDDFDRLTEWRFNALTVVAALGFDDIPVEAFLGAVNLVADEGWLAFNIKESFLKGSDQSGFSNFVRQLIFSEYIDIHHLERYQHRLSMEGNPLYYYALVAKKKKRIPHSFENS